VFGLLILSAFFLLNACNKESKFGLDNSTLESRDIQSEIPIFTSSQIDSIGIEHNNFLEAIMNSDSFGFIDGFYQRLARNIENYSVSHNVNISPLQVISFGSNSAKIADSLYEGYIDIHELGFSEETNKFLIDLHDKIDNFSNYSVFLLEIENLKSKVSTSDLLNIHEKQMLNIALSVAKNSVYYWAPVELGGQGSKIELYSSESDYDLASLQLRNDGDCKCTCGAVYFASCGVQTNCICCGGGGDGGGGTGGNDGFAGGSGWDINPNNVPWWKNPEVWSSIAEADVWGGVLATISVGWKSPAYAAGIAGGTATGGISSAAVAVDVARTYAWNIGSSSVVGGISAYSKEKKKKK